MSRNSLVEAVVRTAKNLGWQNVEADDAGTTVTLLVSAPGATEQIVEGALHSLPKQLKDLGGPELYPATEEYEVPDDGLCDNEACQMPATTELPDGTPVCDECTENVLKEEFEHVVEHSNIVPEVHEPAPEKPRPAPAENTPDEDTSAAEDTDDDEAALQVGPAVYVIRVKGREVARTVYKDRAVVLARNRARKAGKENVGLFKVPVKGHISTALPRPVGERHGG